MRIALFLLLNSALFMTGCTHVQHKTAQIYHAIIEPSQYAKVCQSKSKFVPVEVLGQSINTPDYALLTLSPKQNTNESGELCVINKRNQAVEVTPIRNLQFISTQNSAVTQ